MGFSTGPFTFAHNNVLGFGFLESLTLEACENDLRSQIRNEMRWVGIWAFSR